MTLPILFQLSLLAVAIVLFASERIRPDAVAVGLILVLMLTGQVTKAEALSGFGNPLVVMVAGLFLIGESLARTGIAHSMGEFLTERANGSQAKLIATLMAVVALLSAFMSSTGAVAVFIPVAMTMSRRMGIPVARLLMPISFASLLGGLLTLIGTAPNLAVSAALEEATDEGFSFFQFTPISLVILVVCIVWMVLVGRHGLGKKQTEIANTDPTILDLADRYGVKGTSRCARITHGSPAAGANATEFGFGSEYEVVLLGVERKGRITREALAPSPELVLRRGDLLHVSGEPEALERLFDEVRLVDEGHSSEHEEFIEREIGLAEGLIPPHSPLANKPLSASRMRSLVGLTALAVRRRGGEVLHTTRSTELAAGDTVLVSGGWNSIRNLGRNPRIIAPLTLPREIDNVVPARSRAPFAVAVLVIMLGLFAFPIIPAVATVLLAALALVATKCVTPPRVYRCIDWPSIVLIAGMLPVSTALQRSGAVTLIVDGVMATVGTMGPHAVLAGLFLLTATFSQFISNTATAVLVSPIAILVAQELGVSPRPMGMAVALAASSAFLTPVSTPINTMVMGPGNYKFFDYVKTGTPLFLISFAITMFLVPVVFPF